MDHKQIVCVQSIVRRWLQRRRLGKPWSRAMERCHVLREIVHTERVFVNCMKIIQDLYITPLSDYKLLSPDEVQLVFGQIPTILIANSQLLRDIEQRLDARKSFRRKDFHCLGDVFSKAGLYVIKSYTSFCSLYEDALQLVKRKSANPAFQRFLDQCMQDSRAKMQTLESLMIRPVQRLSKYPLLINELIKDTCEYHPDRKALEEALEKVKEATFDVNGKVQDMIMRKKFMSILEKVHGVEKDFLVPHRRFVKEGILKKISDRAIQARQFFLFSDCLMYCKGSPGNLRCSGTIWLKNSPVAWARKLSDAAGLQHLFQIVVPHRTYTLIADSNDDRDSWVAAIEAQVAKLIENTASLRGQPKADVTFLKINKFWQLFTLSPSEYDPDYKKRHDMDVSMLKSRPDCRMIKTLYAYPTAGCESHDTDLIFPAHADIVYIPVTNETADWKFGQFLGKQGWFPVNYCEVGSWDPTSPLPSTPQSSQGPSTDPLSPVVSEEHQRPRALSFKQQLEQHQLQKSAGKNAAVYSLDDQQTTNADRPPSQRTSLNSATPEVPPPRSTATPGNGVQQPEVSPVQFNFAALIAQQALQTQLKPKKASEAPSYLEAVGKESEDRSALIASHRQTLKRATVVSMSPPSRDGSEEPPWMKEAREKRAQRMKVEQEARFVESKPSEPSNPTKPASDRRSETASQVEDTRNAAIASSDGAELSEFETSESFVGKDATGPRLDLETESSLVPPPPKFDSVLSPLRRNEVTTFKFTDTTNPLWRIEGLDLEVSRRPDSSTQYVAPAPVQVFTAPMTPAGRLNFRPPPLPPVRTQPLLVEEEEIDDISSTMSTLDPGSAPERFPMLECPLSVDSEDAMLRHFDGLVQSPITDVSTPNGQGSEKGDFKPPPPPSPPPVRSASTSGPQSVSPPPPPPPSQPRIASNDDQLSASAVAAPSVAAMTGLAPLPSPTGSFAAAAPLPLLSRSLSPPPPPSPPQPANNAGKDPTLDTPVDRNGSVVVASPPPLSRTPDRNQQSQPQPQPHSQSRSRVEGPVESSTVHARMPSGASHSATPATPPVPVLGARKAPTTPEKPSASDTNTNTNSELTVVLRRRQLREQDLQSPSGPSADAPSGTPVKETPPVNESPGFLQASPVTVSLPVSKVGHSSTTPVSVAPAASATTYQSPSTTSASSELLARLQRRQQLDPGLSPVECNPASSPAVAVPSSAVAVAVAVADSNKWLPPTANGQESSPPKPTASITAPATSRTVSTSPAVPPVPLLTPGSKQSGQVNSVALAAEPQSTFSASSATATAPQLKSSPSPQSTYRYSVAYGALNPPAAPLGSAIPRGGGAGHERSASSSAAPASATSSSISPPRMATPVGPATSGSYSPAHSRTSSMSSPMLSSSMMTTTTSSSTTPPSVPQYSLPKAAESPSTTAASVDVSSFGSIRDRIAKFNKS
ncbi:conserved mitochondrial protein containing domains RhoGEF [Andalucia godoyi]|uniref:Conserved mitochondrial protein containing domains RhoGEF n=1 Tax=Andalucia godoyi TaxID=505711 RepID=A0A8K0AIG3_ANDGO|nr:conserved mitochondrial protein containing domains RhoGEF [Andalucia godoyi]|eukprot:ANDGO_02128.mRNA.1 conserved mitochondrial protein containing domains RhoGEF